MRLRNRLVATLAASITLTACHARWNPLARPPDCNRGFRDPNLHGRLGEAIQVDLTEDVCGYSRAVTFELPASGTLSIHAEVRGAPSVAVFIFPEGLIPLAKAEIRGEGSLTLAHAEAAEYFISVARPWRDATPLSVVLRAELTPEHVP